MSDESLDQYDNIRFIKQSSEVNNEFISSQIWHQVLRNGRYVITLYNTRQSEWV